MTSGAERTNDTTADSQESWRRVRLGDLCEIVRGVTYKKDQASDQPATGMVPVLRATNIQDSALVLDSDLVYVPSEVVSDEQMLRVGDIVVATSSGSKHLVGKTAQVKESWRGSFGAFCAALRPKTEIDHRYLGYFFGSHEYKDYIRKKALGVNINNLRRGDIEEIAVPVAPLDQQKLIVAEIEKQFSRLDEAVANLKRVKTNLKRYKATVLKAAVEGRLVETEAELARKKTPSPLAGEGGGEGASYETGAQLLYRILEARRSQWKGKGKYKEPAAPDTTELPELPEGWVYTSIDQLLPPARDAMKTGPFGSLLKKHEHRNAGVAVLGIENIEAMRFVCGSKIHVSLEKADELAGYAVTAGDVLISRSGTVGEVCVVPRGIGEARISTNLMKVSLAKGGMLPEFFVLLFNGSPFVLKQVSDLCKGSTRDFLNQEILRQLYFTCPPLNEQIRIVAEVDRCFSLVREVETQVDANLKRAERLRQSILSSFFAGKLLNEVIKTIPIGDVTHGGRGVGGVYGAVGHF